MPTWHATIPGIAGSFSQASIDRFEAMCSPSATSVFGRPAVAGQSVASFCNSYPCALAFRAASGSSLACAGFVAPIPASAHLRTLNALGFSVLDPDTLVSCEDPFQPRQFHDDPECVNELADCQPRSSMLLSLFASGHVAGPPK